MKLFTTKYALFTGIQEIDGDLNSDYPEMITVGGWHKTPGTFRTCYHGEGREWHRTKEAAIQKAEMMRLAKISSLNKKIRKLENLKFA